MENKNHFWNSSVSQENQKSDYETLGLIPTSLSIILSYLENVNFIYMEQFNQNESDIKSNSEDIQEETIGKMIHEQILGYITINQTLECEIPKIEKPNQENIKDKIGRASCRERV